MAFLFQVAFCHRVRRSGGAWSSVFASLLASMGRTGLDGPAMKQLFALNPDLDRKALASRFTERSRVQVRDVLTRETAEELRMIMARHTPWGMAVQAGDDAQPRSFSRADIQRDGTAEVNRLANEAHAKAAKGEYAFRFAQYPILTAYQEKWAPDGPHDLLLEHLNAEPFLKLVREVTGIAELKKADGQASLFAPQHFLGRHIDSHVKEGWRVAYVLNLTIDDWHPDWGGYLLFLDEDGDVIEGFRPRFNSLNLFAVPQSHQVSYVAPFAPMGRFAVTGWLRDR